MRAALVAALGWEAPKELADWIDVDRVPKSDSGWHISLEVSAPKKGKAQTALVEQPILLLMGLVPFAQDGSGDEAWASVMPHPLGLCEVHLYNHENGELEDKEGESLADFVAGKWLKDGDKKGVAARKALAKRAKKALAKRPKNLAPNALFSRANWLLGLIAGEPAFRFAEHLAKAPPASAWKSEKTTPELALYWMLAHCLFGDDAACREAVSLAKKSTGHVVAELAVAFEAFLDGKTKSPIDAWSAEALASHRALVMKNALGKKSGGEASHDAALKALAKEDPTKAEMIGAYFKERTDEYYNQWPYKSALPEWIVPAVAAGFRSGLAVDLGHPKAFAGVTQAVDHPDARAALIEAITTLTPDDARLEHVLPALAKRTEPEVREAVRAAAWRWLDAAARIDEVLKKRQERNTLDDMFSKDDLLQPAVHAVLARGDDEAEKLALAISDRGLSFRVLKSTAGRVFRVYGKRGLKDRVPRMEKLLALLDEVPGGQDPEEPGVRLDMTAAVAMAEASLAIARLDPARGKTLFAAALARPRRNAERQAAVAACLLPGLIELDKTNADAMLWLERVLGARSAPPWVYGALIAAQALGGRDDVARWVLPHAYTSHINSVHDEFREIEAVARETLEILGKPAPPVDEGGPSPRKPPKEEAGVAAIAAWLEDFFRFSLYEPRSHFTEAAVDHAVAHLKKTPAGKQELAKLRGRADMSEWGRGMLK